MPPLPPRRTGKPLQVKGRLVPFSFWPVRKATRRYGLQTDLFVKSPWPVIATAIDHRCEAGLRPAAKAFLQQAHDFHTASQADVVAAKPLLLYYAFLNLAKAFILTKGTAKELSKARHGLKDDTHEGERRFQEAVVRAFSSEEGTSNVYDLFSRALGAAPLPKSVQYALKALLPQLVIGHRAWVMATNEKERFIPLHELRFYSDSDEKCVWLTIVIVEEDVKRFGISHKAALSLSGLSSKFREVQWGEEVDGKSLFAFEQRAPVPYGHRPSDVLLQVIEPCRHLLWPIVRTVPPYRRYYIYLAPPKEPPLHPLCSAYMLMFYLGSVTRYRPQDLAVIKKSKFHALVENFLDTYPGQLFYLLASEFAERDVCWPAVL